MTKFPARRRVAVIGAGISGMAAAHLLADSAGVVLYEADDRPGGHARTVIAGKRGDQPVDMGFIVYNRVNYPHLSALFDRLDVPVCATEMSFGASIALPGGRLEYGLAGARALLAQPWRAADPRFVRMVRDILRFNARAKEAADDPALTIGALLERLSTGAWFRDHYLLPFSGAIWSTPVAGILDFPAQALVRFFDNHALLASSGQHQWMTVRGGSVEYVRRLTADLVRRGVEIRSRTPVVRVVRGATPGAGVTVHAAGAGAERFDDVVFATHSDDALSLLGDASGPEREALSAVRYQDNHAVLHADPAAMPRRRSVWSSWNYRHDADAAPDRIGLTYWMNALQPIPKDDPLFVTLNGSKHLREDLIHAEATFRHPVYDLASQDGRVRIRAMNGARGTWFCGAWMRDGFHEDGFASAVDVVQAMLRPGAFAVAAE